MAIGDEVLTVFSFAPRQCVGSMCMFMTAEYEPCSPDPGVYEAVLAAFTKTLLTGRCKRGACRLEGRYGPG